MNNAHRKAQTVDVDELWLHEWAREGIAELERRLDARELQIARYAAEGLAQIERSLKLHAAFERYVRDRDPA